jgi:hypothetical protein
MAIYRLVLAAGILALSITMFCAATATAADNTIGEPGETTHYAVARGPLIGRSTVRPPKGVSPDEVNARIAAPPVATVPYWQTNVSGGGIHTKITMVGTNPMVSGSNKPVHVKMVIIPVKVTMGRFVFDPTTVDTECEPAGSAIDLIKQSPILNSFTLTVGGTTVGTGQYPDLFQRGNFYKFVKPGALNPNYHLVLDAAVHSISYDTEGRVDTGIPCGMLGQIDLDDWDAYAQKFITDNPSLLPPSVFPFFVFYNVVFSKNGSNVITGYHAAMFNPKFQGAIEPYGAAEFDSTHDLKSVSDISNLSHEINEWQDDPGTTNKTPLWGHIGQAKGCQSDLEVSDPLSEYIYPITMNGFTYHVQDGVFVSWFYDTSPATRSNGWYSLYGSGSGETSFKTHFAKEPCKVEFTTLYSFCSQGGTKCTDGVMPLSGVVRDTLGNLYGTTSYGGSGNRTEGSLVAPCSSCHSIPRGNTIARSKSSIASVRKATAVAPMAPSLRET